MTPFDALFDVQATAVGATADFVERASTAPERADTMASVEVGTTPSELVYTENKLRLIHYHPLADEPYDIPLLVVYALINRPYILDLQPDRSVVRRLLEGGFDVYLIDWGEPSSLDASLTLDDYVLRYLDNCVDVVRDRSGSEAINVLGYCMGGTMSAMYAAIHPEKVRNLALMAASLYFDDTGGVLEQWGAEEHFAPGALENALGNVPAAFFDLGFAMMDPIENAVTKYARLYDNLDDEEFVENFARMERWLSDGIDMAGATYRQFIRDIYQQNKLARNELYLGGTHVDVHNLDMPVLQVLAEYDHLVPREASQPFGEVIPSDDVETLEIPTGHVGLSVSRTAHTELWPAVCEWFADRSIAEDPGLGALEDIDGIGSAYAERLHDVDVDTIDQLATADAESLAEQIGVSNKLTEDWIEEARRVVERD